MLKSALIDASVLVSAFLFPNSTPARVLHCAERALYEMHISPIIQEETRRSLCNPGLRNAYGHTEQEADAWCAALTETGCLLTRPLTDIPPICRDPDDDHVIAAALAVKADYIVTGDKDLLTLAQYETICIVTARQFLDEIDPDS